jgi:hypothetical protein
MTFSKRSALGPVVNQPEDKASVKASISKGPILGGEKLTKDLRGLRSPMSPDILSLNLRSVELVTKFFSKVKMSAKRKFQNLGLAITWVKNIFLPLDSDHVGCDYLANLKS